jgi:phosphatidylserine/phosphatidylglycerophosphate/cardiolipin synthase-like enzyme
LFFKFLRYNFFMKILSKIILLFCLSINAYSIDKVYFLPNEANEAEKKIEHLIKNSKSTIKIAMYNFDHKKFRKALKKAHENGVKIDLYFDNTKSKKSKIDFINFKTFDEKMHMKVALFDGKIAVFGSANWKKESFKKNFEIIYISDKKDIVKQIDKLFVNLNSYNHKN